MKKLILFLLTAFTVIELYGQSANNKEHAWFEVARFGLFVHFGPYSVLSDGERVM